jgi:hypothetical protein
VSAVDDGGEAVVITIVDVWVTVTDRACTRLVDDVDAMSTSVSTQDVLTLSIKSGVVHTELTHGRCSEATSGAKRNGTLHAPMRSRTGVGNHSGVIEGHDLTGGQLLLVEHLLLLLKGFDLVLNGNLLQRNKSVSGYGSGQGDTLVLP